MRRVMIASALVGSLLAACSGDGGEPSTTGPAGSGEPAASSTVATTTPDDGWDVVSPVGLDLINPTSGPQLFLGAESWLLWGTAPDGSRVAATSSDRGATWLAGVWPADLALNQPRGGYVAFIDDGTKWVALFSGLDAAGTRITTDLVEQAADGSWVRTRADLAGLASDQVLPDTDTDTYRHFGTRYGVRLAGGMWVLTGDGQWAHPFSTGDSTPFVATSADGEAWTVAPGVPLQYTHAAGLLIGPGSAEVLVASKVGGGDPGLLRIQRTDGTLVREEPIGEFDSVVAVESTDGFCYTIVASTTTDRVATCSPDGVEWTTEPIDLSSAGDWVPSQIARVDDGWLVVTSPADGLSTRSRLLSGSGSTWTDVTPDGLADALFGVLVAADGTPVVYGIGEDAGLVFAVRA